ncbi:hypothetical protein V461_21715 [Pantoea ananatis BRT98]|uniref:hypothetical protein n=1 Tax=Pantoea ananas TaxID=553 RepID=UPI001EE562FB|nr:hypothetical protein [Pantoea ananatis]PKC39245.1 hypothetical protein V461_21715 [Pantoea ananatis BRT98]
MDDNTLALATLQSAKDAADWAFWSMIGTWFSGIATFAAVCVSLHLGLKKPKANINCKIGESIIFDGPCQQRGISIVITNLALNTVKITSLTWDIKKDVSFYQPFYSPRSMQLPKKLDYGEQATFWIDLQKDDQWIVKIAEGLKTNNALPNDFSCLVGTTTGESFSFKVNAQLMNKIKKYYNDLS